MPRPTKSYVHRAFQGAGSALLLAILLQACGGGGSVSEFAKLAANAEPRTAQALAVTSTAPVNSYNFSTGILSLAGLRVIDGSTTQCYDVSLRTLSTEPFQLEVVSASNDACTVQANALGSYTSSTGVLSLPGITAVQASGSSCYDVQLKKINNSPIRLSLVAALAAPCAGTPASTSTAGVACTTSVNAFNADPSVQKTSTSAWACAASRTLAANGIPDHAVGAFPNANNPNVISAQTVSASYTLTPAIVSSTGTAAQNVGYALNGVKFDPATAGTCNDAGTCSAIGGGGNWNLEALNSGFNFGTDSNNAHVQPNGQYHYHGMPEGLIARLGKGVAMSLVGWAADGFPVYARHGFADAANTASGLKVMTSSYQLKTSPDAGRPPATLWKMGTFAQDYRFVAGSGDLDECNGRTGVTPEFPSGTYHYFVTDSYPFIQRCVKGTAAAGPPPRP